MKLWNRIKNALYTHFVRCYMSDEEWESCLDAKRNPVWMQYKQGRVFLYRNKSDDKPFRILRGKEIIWEE